jgi:hypothetical protein
VAWSCPLDRYASAESRSVLPEPAAPNSATSASWKPTTTSRIQTGSAPTRPSSSAITGAGSGRACAPIGRPSITWSSTIFAGHGSTSSGSIEASSSASFCAKRRRKGAT